MAGHLNQASVHQWLEVVLLAKTIAQVVKQLGITEQIFCRWRKEYGGQPVRVKLGCSERCTCRALGVARSTN